MKQILRIKVVREIDEFPDTSLLGTGETWGLMGIHADAEIVVNTVLQRVTSGGLWGIDTDSDDSYLDMVEAEELDTLTVILKELGFAESEIGKVEVEK
ncbi:MAG: hypothetical protein WC489_07110 [Patescibacteria group bacterium]